MLPSIIDGLMGGIDARVLGIDWVLVCDTIGEVVETIEGVGLLDICWKDWEEIEYYAIVREENSIDYWI